MSISSLTKAFILVFFFLAPLHANSVQKKCEYRKFNIKTTQEATILNLIDGIGDLCDFSVVAKDVEAKKLLNSTFSAINIKDMSLHEVFDLLLVENGINYRYKKGVLRLSSLETKTFKIDYITSIREGTATLSASVDVEPVESGDIKGQSSENEIKVKEKFDFWTTLNAELKALLNNGSEAYVAKDPIININTGLITITAKKSQLNRVQKYLNELKDRLYKQVLIDISIIAVELSNDYTSGVDWSKFQLSINKKSNSDGSTTSTGGMQASFLDTLDESAKSVNILNSINFSMEGLINFIKKRGNSKIISNPKVMTLNNQQALITIGDNINYRVLEDTTINESGKTTVTYTPYSVFVGVLLNLLPEVSDDNKIMLRINPSLSSFKYSQDNEKQTSIREIAPDTLEKKLSTVVQVNSGDTIILGGLIGQTKGKNRTSVPFLGDIPLLGNAFKSTHDAVQTTELVFVITPYVMNLKDKKPINRSLRDLGFSELSYE